MSNFYLISIQDEIRRVVKSFPSKFVVDKNLPSASLLSTWINDRAKNFYEESALVDHALALLNCAELNGKIHLFDPRCFSHSLLVFVPISMVSYAFSRNLGMAYPCHLN